MRSQFFLTVSITHQSDTYGWNIRPFSYQDFDLNQNCRLCNFQSNTTFTQWLFAVHKIKKKKDKLNSHFIFWQHKFWWSVKGRKSKEKRQHCWFIMTCSIYLVWGGIFQLLWPLSLLGWELKMQSPTLQALLHHPLHMKVDQKLKAASCFVT